MRPGDIDVELYEFRQASAEDQRAWVEYFYKKGATQHDLAKLLGTSDFTMSVALTKIGANRHGRTRTPEDKKRWENYLRDYGKDEWDTYTTTGEDNSYPLTDADFEGYASAVASRPFDLKAFYPDDGKPISGKFEFYGDADKVAELWKKYCPDKTSRYLVTISWE